MQLAAAPGSYYNRARKGGGELNRSMLEQRLYLSGIDDQAAAIARSRGLGYEITKFCYAPELDRPEAFSEVQADIAGLSRLWLHAPFAELCPCAVDPMAREVTRRRYRQAFDMAGRLGVRRLVIHGGFIPFVYYPEWYVSQSVEFWRAFLKDVPSGMQLVLENVMEPGPDTLVEIVRQVDDPRLGLCLDIGHANTVVSHTKPMDWIAPMQPFLRHVHLHDNLGEMDLHLPLGEGSMPVTELLDALLELCPETTFTLENQQCAGSLSFLRENGYLEERK